jgi:hypothetical protein
MPQLLVPLQHLNHSRRKLLLGPEEYRLMSLSATLPAPNLLLLGIRKLLQLQIRHFMVGGLLERVHLLRLLRIHQLQEPQSKCCILKC